MSSPMLPGLTREYPRHRGTGTRCVAVCQNAIPYPYPRYPFWKNHRFARTCAEPYASIRRVILLFGGEDSLCPGNILNTSPPLPIPNLYFPSFILFPSSHLPSTYISQTPTQKISQNFPLFYQQNMELH
jgi:hypothetical protein